MIPRAAPLAAAAMGAAAAVVGTPAHGDEPAVVVTGLGDGPAFDRVRAAVGRAETAPTTRAAARRRANAALTRVRDALRAEGYFAASVELDVPTRAPYTPTLTADPGPLFTFGAVSIDAPADTAPAVRDAAERAVTDVTPGGAARTADILAAERAMVAAARAAGAPDTRAGARDVLVDHTRGVVDVAFTLTDARSAVFGPLVSDGPARVSPGWLATASPIEPGAPASPSALAAFTDRLQSTGAFSAINVSLDPPSTDAAPAPRPVRVALDDAPRHTVALGAAFSTSEGAGVEAQWTRRNLTGRADALSVSAELGALTRGLEADYVAPFARHPDRTARADARLSDETTDAFDRQAARVSATAEQRLTDRLAASLGGAVETARTEDPDGVTVDYLAVSGAAGAVYTDVDDALDPRRGVRAAVAAEPTATLGDEPVGYVALDGAIAAYRPIADERVVAALRVRVASLVGADAGAVPPDRRYYAGGGGSVRGYEFQTVSPRDGDGDLFGGASLVETSAEIRWTVRGRFGAVVFVDAGAASTSATPTVDGLRAGAGVGVRYDAGFGPLRADVAVPLDPQDGEPAFQVYLGIGQSF